MLVLLFLWLLFVVIIIVVGILDTIFCCTDAYSR